MLIRYRHDIRICDIPYALTITGEQNSIYDFLSASRWISYVTRVGRASV